MIRREVDVQSMPTSSANSNPASKTSSANVLSSGIGSSGVHLRSCSLTNLLTVAEKIFKSKSVSLQAGPSSTRSKTSQIVTNDTTSN